MKNNLFNDKQVKLLTQNCNVRSVTQDSIKYTDAFKWHFISERLKGKNAAMIFEEAGFPKEILASTHLVAMTRQWPTGLSLAPSTSKLPLRPWFSFMPQSPKKSSLLLRKKPARLSHLEEEKDLLTNANAAHIPKKPSHFSLEEERSEKKRPPHGSQTLDKA